MNCSFRRKKYLLSLFGPTKRNFSRSEDMSRRGNSADVSDELAIKVDKTEELL